MQTYTHNQFNTVFQKEMKGSYEANQNQEILILGAVQLYWNHNKNIAYLNSAMQYARGRRGIRVNAVKAFLEAFTGSVFHKGKDFTAAGRKVTSLPEEFSVLDSWLDWADKNAEEPEYNLSKQQLKVINFLQHQKKQAAEHEQQAMVDMLSATIVQYVEANKKVAIAS